jgi:hypothetical protein
MLELLMSEWEDLLENLEYEPVHHALRAGITLLEKYYRRADDTDVYFIAHGKFGFVIGHLFLKIISVRSRTQTRIS